MQLFDIQEHPHLLHDIQVEQASQRTIHSMVVAYLQTLTEEEQSYAHFLDVFNLCIRRSHDFKLKRLEQAGADTNTIDTIKQQLQEYDELVEKYPLPAMKKWRQGHTSPVSAGAMTALNFNKATILKNPKLPEFLGNYFHLMHQLMDEPELSEGQVWSAYSNAFGSSGFPEYFNAKTLANSLYIIRPDVFPLVNDYVLGELQKLLKNKVELSPDGYSAAAAEMKTTLNRMTGGAQHFGQLDRIVSYQVKYPEALDQQAPKTTSEFIPAPDVPLNTIFYGPPGTGKTYHTVTRAVQILDPECYERYKDLTQEASRPALKKRFDELVNAGRVSMTTFHQSFAYEDFVEGIKAETPTDETGEKQGIHYQVRDGVFKALCQSANSRPSPTDDTNTPPAIAPYVLIIDEINRGNISRIFGELITLLEPSKRAGANDQQQVILPYSKQAFSVPANLYVIGTMNTADRSLVQLDLALRRRFEFEEMLPEPELLGGIEIEGINLGKLLQMINERIEILLGRDYMLGHSYLMSLDNDSSLADLAAVFRKRILPLLQEYFFADWEKIRLVLNDQNKAPEHQLITQTPSGNSLSVLFGNKIEHTANLRDQRYCLQESALQQVSSFAQIIPDDAA